MSRNTRRSKRGFLTNGCRRKESNIEGDKHEMRWASLSICVLLSLFNHMTLKGRFKKLYLHTGDEILHSILRE